MEIPDELLCLFTERIVENNGSYCVTIPEQEITNGDIRANTNYRVALLRSDRLTKPRSRTETSSSDTESRPPVEVGEYRDVEIEGLGDQGDGIARIDRGYIIFVPNTEENERVTIEIVNVQPNVAFGEVVKREINAE